MNTLNYDTKHNGNNSLNYYLQKRTEKHKKLPSKLWSMKLFVIFRTAVATPNEMGERLCSRP